MEKISNKQRRFNIMAQAAGRVGRKAEGKERGVVIDFVDSFGMFSGWKKKRMTVYRKLGYGL